MHTWTSMYKLAHYTVNNFNYLSTTTYGKHTHIYNIMSI